MILYLKCIITAIICVGFLHSPAWALNNEEIFSQFQFNFITPGARATAMGGAFIGLADDATAVESNPAGLTQLLVPEVSGEFKHIAYTANHIYANPFPPEKEYDPDFIIETDIQRKEFDDVVESVSFVSTVYPYKRFVFSFYRQELINYKSSYRTSQSPIGLPGTPLLTFPIDASVDLTLINYGAGVAVQLFEKLSLAVSPRWSTMEMKSHSFRFDGDLTTENIIDTTYFLDNEIRMKREIDDLDRSISVNAGVLWKPYSKISIGAVYRSGPTFTVKQSSTGSYNSDEARFTLDIPDSFGAGIAFRATDFLTLTLDVVHIRYEDLLKDFDIVINQDDAFTKENYTVDNVTEVHAGVEYLLLFGERLLALRAGIYTDPDHTIRFSGTTGNNSADVMGRSLFPGGEDQLHITGGLGLVINNRFQIDTAANIADRNKQLSFSAVYRF